MAHAFLIQGGESGSEKAVGFGDEESLTYQVINCAGRHEAILATHLVRPASYVNARGQQLVYSDISHKHIEAETYHVVVKYVNKEQEKDDTQDQELPEIDFDVTGETIHVTHGLAVRAAFPEANADKDMFGGAINVERDTKGNYKVKGVDTEASLLGFTVTMKIPKPVNPFALARSLARQRNKTNKYVWYGFEPTEVLFRGARVGGKTKGKWSMKYMFAASENIAINVPDIAGLCTKRGFDYFWVHSVPKIKEMRDGSKMIVPFNLYAFSHMMHEEFDFSTLGIGG